ncbi:MAG: AraC family transcriptional regulator [Bacilli bacterium]|nr:AraC family transcriptional regulator [Bacilli bacterium]
MFHFEYGNAYIEYKTDSFYERDLLYRHMHDNVEIHFLIKATGSFRIDESAYDIHNRDLIIMPQHVYHYIQTKQNEPYERIILNFPKDFFDNVTGGKPMFDKPLVVNLASHNELVKTFDDMVYFDAYLKDEDDKKAMVLLLAQKIAILLKNTEFETNVSKSVNELTCRAIAYIDEHIYENLTVAKIADALYVSKSHLQNVFLTSMKIGIKAYIIMKKMNIAHTMLQNGNRSTSVASSLGYTTYSCFYKSYVKVFGVPPKDTK